MTQKTENPFAHICTCGLTDWCSGQKDSCGDLNPSLFREHEYKTVPVSELAAPLLEKFAKKK